MAPRSARRAEPKPAHFRPQASPAAAGPWAPSLVGSTAGSGSASTPACARWLCSKNRGRSHRPLDPRREGAEPKPPGHPPSQALLCRVVAVRSRVSRNLCQLRAASARCVSFSPGHGHPRGRPGGRLTVGLPGVDQEGTQHPFGQGVPWAGKCVKNRSSLGSDGGDRTLFLGIKLDICASI